MRLGTKLTTTIAAASVIPIIAASLVGREMVQRNSRAEFDRLLRHGRSAVEDQFEELREEVVQAVQRLVANPDDDRFIGPILIGQAKGGLDDETFRQLMSVTPQVMKGRGLDVLTVLDPRGKILASGHFRGRQGDIDPRMRGRRPLLGEKQAALIPERMMLGGKPVTRLTLQARRTARSSLGRHVRVVVMGGRTLGREFARLLSGRLGRETKVLIQDARGRRLAGPKNWSRYATYPSEVVPLRGPRGRVAARVTLAVPDDNLRWTLQVINVTAGALVVSGLVLSLILGLVAARRISRPMQDLVVGAEAVAQGDLEQQLPVRSRDEIGELVRAFNRMTADLKESKQKLVTAERVAAWREIARRIAHEIKNPLFPIQTSIETLRKVHDKKHPDFEEIFDESTTTILEEVQRLKTIASEFSQFARMPKPKLEPCSLVEVVHSVVTLYKAGEIPIHCELDPALPQVMGDREQLVQVFSNLVKNATEALGGVGSPRIEISARTTEESVEIAISDNGPGFSEEVEAKIFTPYFTTKGSAGGSGLGLAIVHRIVIDHEGRVEAECGPGRGATFRVSFPRA
jgi:signal transduction histidine kinase